MPLTLSLIGAGVGAVSGGISAIAGAKQKKKANQALANNIQPTYQTPQTEWDNISLLENRAGQGLSDSARAAYTNNADRGLAASLSAIQRGGGDANAMGNAFDSYLNNASSLAIADDRLKSQQIQDLIAGRQRSSAFQDKEYQINEYGPWANRQQALTQQAAAGQNQMMSGINTMTSGIMNGISNYGASLYGNTKQGSGATPMPQSPPMAGNPFGTENSWHPPMAKTTGYGMTLQEYPDYMGMNSSQKGDLYNQWLQFQK